MGNMFGMFPFAFWVIRTLKCEMVNFLKFESAGVPIRPFEYLGPFHLEHVHLACMCIMHMPIMTSQDSHMMQTTPP